MFDNNLMTLFSLSLIGIAYYLVYRFVAFRLLHWKMIHSIWIPILYGLGFSIFGFSLLMTPWFGANRSIPSILGVMLELNLPIVVFFILFFVFGYFDKKAKQSKQSADNLV